MQTKDIMAPELHNRLDKFKSELEEEFGNNIFPFWAHQSLDERNGGFIGRISNYGEKLYSANKGLILNARILWSFSAAHEYFQNLATKPLAKQAYLAMTDHFWDEKNGGFYWMIDPSGIPSDTRKHLYAQSFAIYGLAVAYEAYGWEDAIKLAIKVFDLIELHARDFEHGGYVESLDCEWKPQKDIRLSSEDVLSNKTMNTHLHILEAYTTLYRVTQLNKVKERLIDLISLFEQKIITSEGYLKNFMDNDWNSVHPLISYGHDIEASWLLVEAAQTIGNGELISKTKCVALKMVDRVLDYGFDQVYGGVFKEGTIHNSMVDSQKDWWPQAEAIVGFLNAYQITKDLKYLAAMYKTWEFVKNHVIDKKQGEWFESVTREGVVLDGLDKVRSWKAPYHNSRMVFEGIHRIQALANETEENLSIQVETTVIPK